MHVSTFSSGGECLPTVGRKSAWRRFRRRQEEERRKRQAEEEELHRQENERVEKLFAWIEDRERCRRIRELANALEQHGFQLHGEIAPDSKLHNWLTWMRAKADARDPIGYLLK